MDPFDEFERFNKQMRKLPEGLLGGSRVEIFTPFRGGVSDPQGFREPLIDIREDKKTITITAEVPGIEKGDIKLKIVESGEKSIMIISAQKKSSSEGNLSYRKKVLLPVRVKEKTGKASYKNGILEVKFDKAKLEKDEKTTEIPIK